MQQWKNDPAHDATLVVVTDGMQNTAPLITPAPSGFLSLAPVAGLPQELRQRFIPIQMIGFGMPATVDEELLRNISLETAGRSFMGINAATMYDAFAMTLVAVLKGNTASIATRHSSTLTAASPTATQNVVVDQSARRVVFSLQWTPPLREAFKLEVMRPGSTTVATPSRTRMLPHTEIQSFDKPGEGTWSARVVRNAKLKNEDALPYTLNVFFLEQHLDYRLSVVPERATVGKALRLRAEISYDGKPLTGLPAGAVRVRVLRPRATLADVVRSAKGKEARPTPGDPQNEKQLALTKLSSTDIAQLRPARAETLTLREEKNGIYSIPIAKPTIPGSYAFEVVLEWTDKRTGRVHREERIEQFVSGSR